MKDTGLRRLGVPPGSVPNQLCGLLAGHSHLCSPWLSHLNNGVDDSCQYEKQMGIKMDVNGLEALPRVSRALKTASGNGFAGNQHSHTYKSPRKNVPRSIIYIKEKL